MTGFNRKVNGAIRVLIGEDSSFVSKVIADLLGKDPSIDVVGVARDGQEVLKKVVELKPDCVTLDLEMPRMNGLETLRYIMSEWPTPVVILSACGQRAALKALTCLEYGAVDFVPKTSSGMGFPADELLAKVKIAANIDVQKVRFRPPHYEFNMKRGPVNDRKLEALVVIGASTGGPQALMKVIPALPPDLPAAMVVVQHMPPGFTSYLAERLNQRSNMPVKEAANGEMIIPGQVLVAPGGKHLFYEERGKKPYINLLPRNDAQRSACPSIDFAFSSIAPFFKKRVIGVVLTGMGKDGLSGSTVIRKFGGRVIAQDPDTCIAKGMPGALLAEEQADVVAPLEGIASVISEEVRSLVQERKVYGS